MTKKGLISNIYKQSIQLDIKKPNNLILKWSRTEQIFFQRRNADCQQAHENMLNIANHQRNGN